VGYWRVLYVVNSSKGGEVERALVVEVLVFGRNDANQERALLYTRNTTQETVCGQGPGPCEALVLVDERNLKYTYYSVSVRILNGWQMPGDTAPFVGDVRFSIWTGHAGFSTMELALRVIYLFTTCILLVVYLWCMRTTPLDDWSWEQKALAIQLVGLLALNSIAPSFSTFFLPSTLPLLSLLILCKDPFFGLQFAVRGWFFHFLDALFTMTYLSIFLLFGLLVLDKVRLEDVRMTIGRKHIPKVTFLYIYFDMIIT
jgi:hypothetical protein